MNFEDGNPPSQSRVPKIGDLSYGEPDIESVTATSDSVSTVFPGLRPILVGYAFGPKKMSTMGIIMAEASKAFSNVVTSGVPVFDPLPEDEQSQAKNTTYSRHLSALATPEKSGEIPREEMEEEEAGSSSEASDDIGTILPPNRRSCHERSGYSSRAGQQTAETLIHNEERGLESSLFFRSTDSVVSVTESAASGSASASSPSGPASSTSCGKNTLPNSVNRLRPVRVSFVPLDLDSPLEEQHGGDFDAIIHKLTEDILCLSKMSTEARPRIAATDSSDDFLRCVSRCSEKILNKNQSQAVQRVSRLNQYKENHPQCCLVDHPSNVQILMSRSDIAHFLSRCLVGVTSASGIPIGTPRFEIIDSEVVHTESLSHLISHAPFSYPLIAKPLTAAGTAESHQMAIVLNPSGLGLVKSPCLLQEYANHDATLFKVYVLGTTVRVFHRPSLPNLPSGEQLQKFNMHPTGYVEFDSQRPYPTLSDFGVFASASDGDPGKSGVEHLPRRNRKRRREKKPSVIPGEGSFAGSMPLCSFVTAEEVRPVVDILKEAFGLELFGFDILVTNCMRCCKHDTEAEKEMLVVDVNYFPSYKEVTNFPSLLAQYLTQRAIEGRMNISSSRHDTTT